MIRLPISIRRAAVVVALSGVACKGRDVVKDGASSSPTSKPGHYTLDDFRRLRWIEGRWEGFMPDGRKLYESYTIDNDSTIVMRAFDDSTFRTVRYSARIALRNSIITDEISASSWAATRLDSSGLDFAPYRQARNHFTWAREDTTKWNVTFRSTDEQGRPQSMVYALHRFGR